MPPYAVLVDRVAALASTLPPPDDEAVRRVTEICRSFIGRDRSHGRMQATSADADLGRELQRLIETLGRRGAHALPAATLARAAFADLKGDAMQSRMVSREVEDKLAMLGL